MSTLFAFCNEDDAQRQGKIEHVAMQSLVIDITSEMALWWCWC